MDHVPGAARLVAGPDLALTGRAIEPALELDEIIRESIDTAGRFRVGGKGGDRDRLLVHIHLEIDDCASSRNDSTNR